MKQIALKFAVLTSFMAITLVAALVVTLIVINRTNVAVAADKPEPATGGRLGGIFIPPPPRVPPTPQNPNPPITGR